jgi:hypothetical protein
MSEEEKAAPPAPKPKPRPKPTMGFSCSGAGAPCKVFSIIESVPEPAKLPAPTEPKPDEAPPMNGAD